MACGRAKTLEERENHPLSCSTRFISHTMFLKSLYKSQFSHKSVNLFFILVIVKDELTVLWGG